MSEEPLPKRLRTAALFVRTKNYPLSDLIPMMQSAADCLELVMRERDAAVAALVKLGEQEQGWIDGWREGAKFALREMAKNDLCFLTDSMMQAAIKLATDACIKERDKLFAPPSPAPAVPDAEKPEQVERAELIRRLMHIEGSTPEQLIADCEQAAALLAAPVQEPMTENNAVMHLRALVAALDDAFISSWQSTDAWQKELDLAKDFLDSGIGKDQAS